MQGTSDQLVRHQDQSDEQDRSLHLAIPHPSWQPEDQQLVQRRRLMMQDDIMVTGGASLQIVQDAFHQVDARAQQHAAELEHRMEMFMHSTHGSLSNVEARLQERFELALHGAHTDILSATTSTTRDVRDHIPFTDEKVGQAHLHIEAALEKYQIQARATQEFTDAAHVQACHSYLSESIDSPRQWLETTLSSQVNAKMSEVQNTIEQQIQETQNDTSNSVCSLEDRMQAKLNEAIANSSGIRNELTTQLDGATRELVQLVGDKIHATETRFLDFVNVQVAQLEERLQIKLAAANTAAESQATHRLEQIEAKLCGNIRSTEHRVQTNVQAGLDAKLSTMEKRLNHLLQSSNAQRPADASKKIEMTVQEAETRIFQPQEKVHQKAQVAHSAAITDLETRLKQTLQVSREVDSEKVKTILKTFEQNIQSRLAANPAGSAVQDRQTMDKSVQDFKHHVSQEQLRMNKMVQELKQHVEEKIQIALEQAAQASDRVEKTAASPTLTKSAEGYSIGRVTPPVKASKLPGRLKAVQTSGAVKRHPCLPLKQQRE